MPQDARREPLEDVALSGDTLAGGADLDAYEIGTRLLLTAVEMAPARVSWALVLATRKRLRPLDSEKR